MTTKDPEYQITRINNTTDDLCNKGIVNKQDRNTQNIHGEVGSNQQVGSSSQSFTVDPQSVLRDQSPFNAIKKHLVQINPRANFKQYPVLCFPTVQQHILLFF